MLKKYQKISKRGFTVIEILLVVTLVSILLTIGIVAFNQEDRFINARNDARKLHVQSLEAAITQYRLQEGNYPTGLDRNYKEICDPGASSCTNFIDLKTALVPKYLQSIPKDPNDTDSTGGVGYEVAVDAITNTVSIRLKEALREDGVIIAVNDPLPPDTTDTTNNVLNPTPVINGLVLNLDAGNMSSYPGTGVTWFDLSGSGKNGTLVNGVGYNNTDNPGSLTFNGTSQYVNVSCNSDTILQFGTGDFTIDTWIYIDNIPTSNGYVLYDSLVLGGNGARDNAFVLLVKTSGKLDVFTEAGFRGESSGSLSSNTWYHITLTRTSGVWRYYINSSLDPVSYSNTVNLTSTGCIIGRVSDVSGYYMKGRISSVKIYNRALTGTEVQQNYNAKKGSFGL